LDRTEFAQPAIFAVQIALAELWRSWGIIPQVVVGHSLGEAAAAVASGALSLEDGVRVVYHRSRLMKTVAGKGMTAVVGLPLDQAMDAIRGREDRLGVAGCNGPASSVLSGDPEAVRTILQVLEAKGVFCRAVAGVDIAFHSPQMDPLQEELAAALEGLGPRPAAIPIVSTVTGQPIDGPSLDAGYWGRNSERGMCRRSRSRAASGALFGDRAKRPGVGHRCSGVAVDASQGERNRHSFRFAGGAVPDGMECELGRRLPGGR
jgi:acyl transferase domain-containing protein